MAAIAALTDYGSDSNESTSDKDVDTNLHLTPIDKEAALPSTSLQIVAAPVVASKVCYYLSER